MNEEEYLKKRLDDQINWYDQKSIWNQRWFKRFQIFQLIAAASIPVFVSYVTDSSGWLRLVVAVLGAAIAIVSGIIGLYKLQENWFEYRTTCESLRHEQFLYLTKTEPYNIETPFPLLVNRVETLISKENTNWAQHMKKVVNEKKRAPAQPSG